MNLCGSYRAFLKNSRSAMVAAIEVYNKPTMRYREECSVILVINAWELLAKAILAKARRRVYYSKKRGLPYRTLGLFDALHASEDLFPMSVPPLAVMRNLGRLSEYRDNCVHFYNQPGFGAVIHALAQTSVLNYRDLLSDHFGVAFENEVNYVLLPLALGAYVDPIAFIGGSGAPGKRSRAVSRYLVELRDAVKELSNAGIDPGRLLTTFRVSLQSVKKITQADVTAAIDPRSLSAVVVERRFDPNDPNWIRQKDLVEMIDDLHGIPFTKHVCQALVWKHDLKSEPKYCWIAREGILTKYSREVVAFFKRLSRKQVETAIADYKAYMRRRRQEAN